MEIVEPKLSDLESKEKEYSEGSLWDKIAKYSKAAGCSVVYAALLLFYAAQDEKIPMKTRMIIYGALGYFISPLDLIPDITPIVGYADDMAGLLLALGVVSMYITDDVKKQAKSKLSDWFGDGCGAEQIEDIDAKIKG